MANQANPAHLGIINSVTEQWERREDCPHDDTLELGFQIAADNGAKVIDLDLQQKEDLWGDEPDVDAKLMAYAKRAKCVADDLGLTIRSVPLCSLGTPDWNRRVRRFYVDRARHYMDCGLAAGATRLLHVVGEEYWDREVIPRLGLRGFAAEAAHLMGEQAAERAMMVDTELEPFKKAVAGDALTLRAFLKEVDMPDTVVANIDVQHFILTDALPDDLEWFRGASHCHLSDCNLAAHGDLAPGEGKISEEDWIAWMKKMQELNVLHWMLELEFAEHEPDIPAYINRAFEGAKRLAEKAGVELVS